MKVKLKKEIVTMGQPDVDPKARVGHYVDAKDWNELITSPDLAVIDTRNDYEVGIGTFKGAIDPQIKYFRDFPKWWENNKERFQNKRIAMFCTGGIRCEKSTNYLLGQGVEEVYHLKGGILKYLETVPETDSKWRGECFVFDERVSVKHDLTPGEYDMCHACKRPITDADKAEASYVPGVSCPHCIDEMSDEQRARFAERQKQMARIRMLTTRLNSSMLDHLLEHFLLLPQSSCLPLQPLSPPRQHLLRLQRQALPQAGAERVRALFAHHDPKKEIPVKRLGKSGICHSYINPISRHFFCRVKTSVTSRSEICVANPLTALPNGATS